MSALLAALPFRAGQLYSVVASAIRRHIRILLVFLFILLALSSIDVYHRERHAYAVLSFVGLKTFSKSTKSFFPPSSPESCSAWPESGIPPPSMVCSGFPKHLLQDIQIVIRTGAPAKYSTEILLKTTAACIDNALIVSDAPGEIAGQEVIDILADLPSTYTIENPDWAAYPAQLEALAKGEDVAKSREGWKLDRFKFLPMIDRAYATNPTAKWYVFIEDDIYYFWDTLFRLLSFMDPNEYHYMGSGAPGAEGHFFAYGGGGVVMSHALVRDLTKKGKQNLAEKYELMARADCCGDALIAYIIIKELGVRVETLYPMISGEALEWLGVSQEKWCIPLLGLHHVGPEQRLELWKWERCRAETDKPLTFATFLDYSLTPLLENNVKIGWDNGASNRLPQGTPGNESARACEMACAARKDCLEWKYSDDDKCRVANLVNGGIDRMGEEADLVSDWHLEALGLLGYDPTGNPNEFCKNPRWLIPRIMGS